MKCVSNILRIDLKSSISFRTAALFFRFNLNCFRVCLAMLCCGGTSHTTPLMAAQSTFHLNEEKIDIYWTIDFEIFILRHAWMHSFNGSLCEGSECILYSLKYLKVDWTVVFSKLVFVTPRRTAFLNTNWVSIG